MHFFTELRKIVKYYRQYCIAKVAEARLEEVRVRKSLEFWQTKLHFDPQNEASKLAIKDLQFQLLIFMNRKEDGHSIRTGTK